MILTLVDGGQIMINMYNEEQYFPYTNKQKLKAQKMDKTTITLDKGNLNGIGSDVNPDALYFIDFSKLQRLEDLILILASIGFSFSPRHPHFELIKPFMNLDNPVLPHQLSQGAKPEIKLPKLKKPNGAE